VHKNRRLEDHQKFKELSALAQGGLLNGSEREELDHHLEACDWCREIHDEYSLISTEGMPLLGVHYSHAQDGKTWDNSAARNRLLARIREPEQSGPRLAKARPPLPLAGFFSQNVARRIAFVAMAACLIFAVGAGGYHFGRRTHDAGAREAAVVSDPSPTLASEKQAAHDLLDADASRISQLQKQIAVEQQELVRLRTATRAADDHSIALSAANSKNQEQLRQVLEQRDKLAGQLRDAEHAYQSAQFELTALRAEHDRVLLRTTSLESKVEELTASTREQEHKLRDDEQYLASDRDIRELMGARKLYIADVFDVDSRSRTRKPFGRVFYTQSKSLIFYAFDLDHEAGVKNASTFQVWGQRDSDPGQKAHPTNLGILYMDSELNRRWVLRFDDPKELSEIDAVFVTVEPHGGSQKPTGKPLLYALLRKEANHP